MASGVPCRDVSTCYLLAVYHWASGTASLCRFLLSHVSEQWYQPHDAGQEHA